MPKTAPSIQTPDWVKDAVFYQIFPDRFHRSARQKSQPGIQFEPWGSAPKGQGYQGGDLYGVVDKLDYLADLGINAIYLNPILPLPQIIVIILMIIFKSIPLWVETTPCVN